MFQHYIITRFNLRREDWKTTKNNEIVLSESWLEERFELFNNFCFSSVKNQSNQNFKWLVFFDVNTPEIYKQKIEELRKYFKNFLPFYVDGMKNFIPAIIKNIHILDSKKYIITSRLDNDDSLHKDYTEVVQSYFNEQDYMALDIVDGYSLQIGANVRLGIKRQLYNPFISLVERKENCKTVWHKGHTYWKYERKIIKIKNKRVWLSIIHEKNYSNKFDAYGKVNFSLLNKFNIREKKINELRVKLKDNELTFFQNLKNKWKIKSSFYGKEIKSAIGIYKIKEIFAKNKYD